MSEIIEAGKRQHPDLFEQVTEEQHAALTLIAAVHEGRDKETWGGLRYWDQLIERVRLSRIAGPRTEDWWTKISGDMGVTLWARNRAEVAAVVQTDNPKVLAELADNTEYLVGALFRLCTEAHREEREGSNQEELPI